MEEAFAEAQVAVTGVPDDEPDGNDISPSTTLIAAVATPELVVVGNIGDSRAYWLSSIASTSRVLTADDSWAQDSIADGVAPDLAYAHPDAHTITRWIGGDADSVVPTMTFLEVHGARAARPVHRRALELLRRRRAPERPRAAHRIDADADRSAVHRRRARRRGERQHHGGSRPARCRSFRAGPSRK